MGMTIKELAAELGVSKETIRKHVAKLPSDHVSHGKRGVISLTGEAVAIIRQQIATYIPPTTDNGPPTTDNELPTTDNEPPTTDNQRLQTELQTANDKIQLLSDNLQDLREQLKQKNAELEAKNKQISDLLQALQAEQILHGQMFQLESPKRKWYEVFKSKKRIWAEVILFSGWRLFLESDGIGDWGNTNKLLKFSMQTLMRHVIAHDPACL